MYPTLPNGIADFRLLRTAADRYLYVDKTEAVAALAAHLLHDPQLFFARPRRFGKTLLVSTLEALFAGEKTLFEDTWLGRQGHWDWREYPVLRLQMDIRDVRTREELANELRGLVTDLAQTAGLAVETDRSPSRMLSRVIRALRKARGRKVVVLIDEYDTPITENIGRPEALADALSAMRAFYGALKRHDECIRCIFMTGITRFSQAGLFSGANHFRDVSLFPEYNSLLGFTQADLRETPALAADVAQCARNVGCTDEALREALRRYYDGYQFSPKPEAVCNPFSLAECLAVLRKPDPYRRWNQDALPNAWAQSGTPELLFRLWESKQYVSQYVTRADGVEDALKFLETAAYAASAPDMTALMYQAGYLTLKRKPEREGQGGYYLDCPNREVSRMYVLSLMRWQERKVLGWHVTARAQTDSSADAVRQALLQGDAEAIRASIDDCMQLFVYPEQLLPHSNKSIYSFEDHYRNLLLCLFTCLNMDAQAEAHTLAGRADIVVRARERVIVIECQLNRSAEEALRQVWHKGYVNRYRGSGKPVTVVGLNFSESMRTLDGADVRALGAYDPQRRRWTHEPFVQHTLAELSAMDTEERWRIVAAWPLTDAV